MGLFSCANIRKGTILWELDPDLDPVVPTFVVSQRILRNPALAAFVRSFAYEDMLRPGHLVFNGDNERFKNDSLDPNCGVTADGHSVAARDIACGEELTNNYEEFLLDSEVGISITWRSRRDAQ